MEQPPGFQQSNGNLLLVCKLKKQKGHLWVETSPSGLLWRLQEFLASVGFISSKVDNSLFLRFTNHSTIFILVYVDDILITGSSITEVKNVITQLNKAFSLKDFGDLNYFFDTEALQTWAGIHLSQTKYITDLLKRAYMDCANALPTPMASTLLSSKQGSLSLILKSIGDSWSSTIRYSHSTDIAFTVN